MDTDGDGHVDQEEYRTYRTGPSPPKDNNQITFAEDNASIAVELDSPTMSRTMSSGRESFELTMLEKKTFTIDFEFDSLSLTLKSDETKQVLSGVTGSIKSGRVTAIMGPSGAGKTTFLSTLSGKAYYGITEGNVKINGSIAQISDYKQVVGFVPQEDTMHRTMTVKENLDFYAQLRLPSSYTAEQRDQLVNETIHVLGIWDVHDIQVGDAETRGISGGQRKRVNIGMELVADPTVLFLDEPTSGLDSTSSFEVLEALKKVAGLGINIIVVLHQPQFRIFKMFDEVLLLGRSGRAARQCTSGRPWRRVCAGRGWAL